MKILLIIFTLISVSCFAQTRTTLTYEANDSIEFVSVLTFDRQKLPRLELKPNETREYHFLKGQNFFPVVVTAPSDPTKTYYIEYTLRIEGEVIIEPDPDPVMITTNIDNNIGAYEGRWFPATKSGSLNNTIHWSCTAGSTLTADFNGSEIAWITEVLDTHGIIEVTIDDQVHTVDLYSPTLQQQKRVLEVKGLTNGPHKIQLKVTGQKNAASRNVCLVHDYFEVKKAQ